MAKMYIEIVGIKDHFETFRLLFVIDNRVVVNSSSIDIPNNILLRCDNINEINLNRIITGNNSLQWLICNTN